MLFASYDSLFSSYNVRVAVAECITGPYRDIRGLSMTDLEAPPASIGTKILGSHRFNGATGWLAPGHSSVLTQAAPDGGDEHFMVHHTRFAADPSQHIVQLRRLFFNAAGWPVVSPQPYAGREGRSSAHRSCYPAGGRWSGSLRTPRTSWSQCRWSWNVTAMNRSTAARPPSASAPAIWTWMQ